MLKKLLTFITLVSLAGSFVANAEKAVEPEMKPLQLKYEKDFNKSENDVLECAYPGTNCQKGVVTYSFKEEGDIEFENYNNHLFYENTRQKIMKYGFKEHKVALKLVDAILNDKTTLPVGSDKIYTAMDLFNDCLDYACPVIAPLNNISIPNVDVAKIFVTMDGQDTLGNVVVRILGRKNTQYILMTARVSDSNLDMAVQKCTDSHSNESCFTIKSEKAQDKCMDTTSKAQETCYLDYIKNTELIQKKIQDEKDVLLRKFVIN